MRACALSRPEGVRQGGLPVPLPNGTHSPPFSTFLLPCYFPPRSYFPCFCPWFSLFGCFLSHCVVARVSQIFSVTFPTFLGCALGRFTFPKLSGVAVSAYSLSRSASLSPLSSFFSCL